MSTRGRAASTKTNSKANDGGEREVRGEEVSEPERSKKIEEHNKKDICKGGRNKVCGTVIPDGEDAVRCDLCEHWYHHKCQDLSCEAFRATDKYEFVWLCHECRPNLTSTLKLGKKIEAWIGAVESNIGNRIESVMGEMEARFWDEVGKQVEEKLDHARQGCGDDQLGSKGNGR